MRQVSIFLVGWRTVVIGQLTALSRHSWRPFGQQMLPISLNERSQVKTELNSISFRLENKKSASLQKSIRSTLSNENLILHTLIKRVGVFARIVSQASFSLTGPRPAPLNWSHPGSTSNTSKASNTSS